VVDFLRLPADCARLHVRGGDVLFRQGDAGDALYVVTYGRLRAVLTDESGALRTLGEIGPGETVGEMALLTGEARSSTVIAVRDSELMRLDRAEFDRLTEERPRMMLDLTRALIARYRNTLREPRSARVTALAIVPADGSGQLRDFIRKLVQVLSAHVANVLHVDEAHARTAVGHRGADRDEAAALGEFLHNLELDHDLVVYEAGPGATTWTTACMRQADIILHVGQGAAPAPPGLPAVFTSAGASSVRPRTELALIHAPGEPIGGTEAWLRDASLDAHYHVVANDDGDYHRLARCLLGTEIGLVLGGGGARGLAHIGVLRALEEAQIPIDRIGGTSAGANIGAMAALGWGWERVLAQTRRTFVDGGSLQDYTLPVHSLLRGERYHRIGQDLYGDRRIEDLAVPYFCVSTNLTRGEAFVHRSGLIRRALRASMTVPGIAPAVFEGREVLVDGGVINNLPVDVMRSLGRGQVIGVDVSPRQELRLGGDYSDTPSPWHTLLHRMLGVPSPIPTIASILTRAVTIPRATIEADPRRQPDLLLEPPVAGFRLLQWTAIDALVEIGYRHACEKLEQWGRGQPPARSESTRERLQVPATLRFVERGAHDGLAVSPDIDQSVHNT
jgi:predicted acylesterase/phospholipase RssA/CRP-like cAMP-binding protein